MIDPTVEQILVRLARKYAPRLIASDWRKPGDLKKPLHILARQLANYHLLVLLAERPEQEDQTPVPAAVQECHEVYLRLYRLLAGVAFPSLTHVTSFFYHGRSTLIVVFEADARRVIEVLAGFVSPYVAERQGARAVANMELQGLMDKILQKLDLPSLAPEQHNQLRDEGVAIIKQMLKMRLRQIPLTWFDEPFFSEIEPETQSDEPQARKLPPLPPLDHLPGEFTSPFEEGTLPILSGDEPDFIRRMSEKRETPSEAEPTQNAPPPTPDTGPQNPVEGSGERSKLIPPPASAGSGIPLPPLPPPGRRKNTRS